MDIESPEAAEILTRGIDSNANALKNLIRIVKGLKGELRELREKVAGLEQVVKGLEK